MATTLTLNGLLPPSDQTIKLTVSVYTERNVNGWTGKIEHHRVLRAVNGTHRYEWRISTLTKGGAGFDSTSVPGGMWVSGFRGVLAAIEAGEILSEDDVRAIRALAEQDRAGEVDDSYARTGDAEDTIQRWYDAGSQAGDRDLIELIDRVGVQEAARIYEAARQEAR